MSARSPSQILEGRVLALRRREDNRTCFECGQRNPMCVCLALNTFVCINCTSYLRAINFHCVNISMNSWTATQVKKFRTKW